MVYNYKAVGERASAIIALTQSDEGVSRVPGIGVRYVDSSHQVCMLMVSVNGIEVIIRIIMLLLSYQVIDFSIFIVRYSMF